MYTWWKKVPGEFNGRKGEIWEAIESWHDRTVRKFHVCFWSTNACLLSSACIPKLSQSVTTAFCGIFSIVCFVIFLMDFFLNFLRMMVPDSNSWTKLAGTKTGILRSDFCWASIFMQFRCYDDSEDGTMSTKFACAFKKFLHNSLCPFIPWFYCCYCSVIHTRC